MKINFNSQFKGIDEKELPKNNDKGELIETNNMGKVIGQALWNFSSGKSLKFAEWGRKFYAGSAVELDTTDYEVLLAWLETYGQDPNYKGAVVTILQLDGIREQAIKTLKSQKEKQESK